MGTPNYNWKADAEVETLERKMSTMKLQSAEQLKKKREMELMKSNIFYPFPSTSTNAQPSAEPGPSTSAMPVPDPAQTIPETSTNDASSSSTKKCQAKFRYDIDEMKYIASKMQLSVLLKKDRRQLTPGPVPYQRNGTASPIRKNGLYRCVPGLEKPEPLNDVLNKLPVPTRRFRMIRKTSNLRSQLREEEEELENMYHNEEP